MAFELPTGTPSPATPITPVALAPAALPRGLAMTPPATPGFTNSVPVNMGLGGGTIGVTNTMTHAAGGDNVTLLAGAIGVASHLLLPHQPPRWAQFLILVFAVVTGIATFWLVGHLEPLECVTRGCGTGVQSWGNLIGIRISGVQALFGGPTDAR